MLPARSEPGASSTFAESPGSLWDIKRAVCKNLSLKLKGERCRTKKRVRHCTFSFLSRSHHTLLFECWPWQPPPEKTLSSRTASSTKRSSALLALSSLSRRSAKCLSFFFSQWRRGRKSIPNELDHALIQANANEEQSFQVLCTCSEGGLAVARLSSESW